MKRLAAATALSTFALILLGGVVRVSDSGLGCGPAGSGFSGWPFCNGDVVPGVDLNSIIEYAHRAVAIAVGLMILALFVMAIREKRLTRPTGAALVLVASQGALGGATVEGNLEEGYVAAHLGLAMLLLALLVYIWRAIRATAREAAPAPQPGPRGLAIAASVAVFATIVAGGYMAGTQNYGRADYQLGDGAHHACGKEFPTCNGEFMPFGEARLVDIHLTHRALMYLASALVLWLVIVALRRRVAIPYAWGAAGLLVTQVLVGALNVWLDEYELLILLHLALGTLLWAAVSTMAMQLSPAPRAQPVPA